MNIAYSEMILRLVVSSILGGIIGLEREVKSRPAGIRTHMLVSLGATLLMLVSMYGFEGGDPARLAAQVVSGIGFLGAGAILRKGDDVSGLTTAASVWVSGGIGLAIGNGYYMGGVITALIVLLCLLSLRVFHKKVVNLKCKAVKIKCIERIGLLGEIGKVVAESNSVIKDIKIYRKEKENLEIMVIKLILNIPKEFSYKNLTHELYKVQGVEKVKWKDEAPMERIAQENI